MKFFLDRDVHGMTTKFLAEKNFDRTNLLLCLDHGCEMGWIIDPAESLIFTYSLGKPVRVFESLTERLPTPEFVTEVSLTPGEVFGWLQV